MALLLVLLTLFLLSAIGLGMLYMSNTETVVNSNYRDTQLAFFAMRGGLEEMRDRMRSNSISPIALPTAPACRRGKFDCIHHQSGGIVGHRGRPANHNEPPTPMMNFVKCTTSLACHLAHRECRAA